MSTPTPSDELLDYRLGDHSHPNSPYRDTDAEERDDDQVVVEVKAHLRRMDDEHVGELLLELADDSWRISVALARYLGRVVREALNRGVLTGDVATLAEHVWAQLESRVRDDMARDAERERRADEADRAEDARYYRDLDR